MFDHTAAAFWQFILYAEIILKIREVLLPKAKYDLNLLKRIKEVEERFRLSDEIVAGDFTSRLELAVRSIVNHTKHLDAKVDIKHELTRILFENDIPTLRQEIVQLGAHF